MTSTYDHRVIQGAESGSFLRRIDELLQGEDEFYESVAARLGVEPSARHQRPPRRGLGAAAAGRGAAGAERRRRPSPTASCCRPCRRRPRCSRPTAPTATWPPGVDPLGAEPKGDPALEPENLNLTPELMAQIPASILRIGVEGETLLDALPRMRDAYCGTIAYQIEHLSSHQQRMWLREMIETGWHRTPLDAEEKRAPARPPDRRVRVRALRREGLPGPEDVLDRGPRRGRADARRARRRWPTPRAPRRS